MSASWQNRLGPIGILVGAAILLAACAPDEPLARLIEVNAAARGGRAAIERVRSVDISFTSTEPEFSVDGRYIADREGRMRVDIFDAGTRVYTEAFDGRRGWQRAAGNAPVQPVSAQGTAALRHGIEAPFKLYGLHELAARGHSVSAVGEESIEGVEYAVIEVRFTDGQEARFYLNPHTGLIERERRLRALHVDVDPTPRLIETLELDYRPVAGVMFPFRQVEREVDSGRVLATTVIASIEVNAELEAADFQPAEI